MSFNWIGFLYLSCSSTRWQSGKEGAKDAARAWEYYSFRGHWPQYAAWGPWAATRAESLDSYSFESPSDISRRTTIQMRLCQAYIVGDGGSCILFWKNKYIFRKMVFMPLDFNENSNDIA